MSADIFCFHHLSRVYVVWCLGAGIPSLSDTSSLYWHLVCFSVVTTDGKIDILSVAYLHFLSYPVEKMTFLKGPCYNILIGLNPVYPLFFAPALIAKLRLTAALLIVDKVVLKLP